MQQGNEFLLFGTGVTVLGVTHLVVSFNRVGYRVRELFDENLSKFIVGADRVEDTPLSICI